MDLHESSRRPHFPFSSLPSVLCLLSTQAIIARLLALPDNKRSQGDLVHVYDALVQNAADIIKLPGVEDLDDILTPTLVSLAAIASSCLLLTSPFSDTTHAHNHLTQALQARFRAHRAFHLAEYHASNKPTPSLPEALVLCECAGTLAAQVMIPIGLICSCVFIHF